MDRQEPTTRERKLLPFGAKAHRFLARDPSRDKRITILEGSVRSSKTWQLIVKIVILCRYRVAGQRLIIGVSKQVVKANLLDDLFEIVGAGNYDYNLQTGELRLFNTWWRVLGAYDEGSEKSIRGATVGVAVTDELTKLPRSFVMMLMSRLSPAEARWYAATNPDNPFHYVRTDLMDREELRRDVEVIHYELDDNPNLSDDFKAFIRRSYTGVWYQRFVLGLWVMAEGAIYRDVLADDVFYDDATRPVGLLGAGGHVERWLAIDVGTTNAFVALDIFDDGTTCWVDREYYWDSKIQQRQKTNGEYADDLVGFLAGVERRYWPGVIVDPAAASFKVELLSRGFFVTDAENEVLEGIRRVSTMLSRKRLRIHRQCVNTIREMQTYAWDEKRSDKGAEQPIKAHDHGADAIRYFTMTRISEWRLAL